MEVECGLEGPQTFFPSSSTASSSSSCSSSSSERSFSCWMSIKTEAVQFQRFIFQTDSGAKTRQPQPAAAEMATGSEGVESVPRGRSQTLQVLSMDPETMSEPSQLNCTLLISPPWPVSTWRHLRKPAGPSESGAGPQTATM